MTTGYRKLVGTVTGQAGSLITYLDALLNIGQPGTYWEKVFTGTNKAVYRATTGDRCYLRVDDSTTFGAAVRGYTAMTDVDTGTGIFPSVAAQSNLVFWKSAAANTTPRNILGIATARSIMLLVEPGVVVTPVARWLHFFGELFSTGIKGPRTVLHGGYNAATSAPTGGDVNSNSSGSSNSNLFNWGSVTAGSNGSAWHWSDTAAAENTFTTGSIFGISMPGTSQWVNLGPVGGSGIPLFPVWVAGKILSASSSLSALRGRLPFVRVGGCPSKGGGIADGDTITDEDGVVWTHKYVNGSNTDNDGGYASYWFMLDADAEVAGF